LDESTNMPISMRCPKCGKNYQLLDEQAGLRVRCKQCQSVLEVTPKEERLEIVPELPGKRGPRLAEIDDDEPELRPRLRKKNKSNRTVLWVVGIVGACFVLSALICGGVIFWVTRQVQPIVKEVVRMSDKDQEQPPAQDAKGKHVEIPMPEFKLPKIEFKDLDDAVQKLRTGNQFTKLSALEYIGKQKPPDDPAKKKAVLDAVDEAGKDDRLVEGWATYVKISWGVIE
jgi:phage FluMu protein Com